MLKEIFGPLLDCSVGDGIASELSTRQDEVALSPFCEQLPYGFLTLRSETFRTRKLDDYTQIVRDPDQWNDFDKQTMDKFFEDAINMFPYEGAAGSATESQADPQAHLTWDVGQPILKPDRFYKIQSELIERRFPGGRASDIGDGDLRDLISGLRYIFAHNYWRLIVARRGAALIAILAVGFFAILVNVLLALFAPANATALAAFAVQAEIIVGIAICISIALIIATAYWVLRKHFIFLQERYESAITNSSRELRIHVEERLQALVVSSSLISQQIDRGKTHFVQELNQWSREALRWTKLAFWLSKRVEYIELFIQIEMWRIRRIHFGMRRIARWLSFLLFIISSCISLALSASFLVWGSPPAAVAAINLCIGTIAICGFGLFSLLTYVAGVPKLNLIEQTLRTSAMMGYKDTRLHKEMGELISNIITMLVHEERKRRDA